MHALRLTLTLAAALSANLTFGLVRAQTGDFQAFLKKIDGATYICPEDRDPDTREANWLKVRGGEATQWKQTLWLSESFKRENHNFTEGQKYPVETKRLTGWRTPGWTGGATLEISESKAVFAYRSGNPWTCIRE